jgi:hypothetical protein
VVWGIAIVGDEGVFDAEFFEEPKDALRLGVLVAESVRNGVERLKEEWRPTFMWWKVGLLSAIVRDFCCFEIQSRAMYLM